MLSRALLWSVLMSLTSACNLSGELLATVTSRPQPVATPVSDWKTIENGLEWRTLRPNGDELSQLVVLRIDPQRTFDFARSTGKVTPRSLAGLARARAGGGRDHQRQLLRPSQPCLGSGR